MGAATLVTPLAEPGAEGLESKAISSGYEESPGCPKSYLESAAFPKAGRKRRVQ